MRLRALQLACRSGAHVGQPRIDPRDQGAGQHDRAVAATAAAGPEFQHAHSADAVRERPRGGQSVELDLIAPAACRSLLPSRVIPSRLIFCALLLIVARPALPALSADELLLIANGNIKSSVSTA